MIFKKIILEGSYIIELEKKEDIRGFFARTFDKDEFKNIGIDFNIVQTSISYNKNKGTLRGMHHQFPYPENKLVQCIKGSIYDVIIDIRKDSKTFKNWFSIELNDRNFTMLYIPKGFAHGFQTLEDETYIIYYMDQFYYPEYAKRIYWNDPEYNIKWSLEPSTISDNDNKYNKK